MNKILLGVVLVSVGVVAFDEIEFGSSDRGSGPILLKEEAALSILGGACPDNACVCAQADCGGVTKPGTSPCQNTYLLCTLNNNRCEQYWPDKISFCGAPDSTGKYGCVEQSPGGQCAYSCSVQQPPGTTTCGKGSATKCIQPNPAESGCGDANKTCYNRV